MKGGCAPRVMTPTCHVLLSPRRDSFLTLAAAATRRRDAAAHTCTTCRRNRSPPRPLAWCAAPRCRVTRERVTSSAAPCRGRRTASPRRRATSPPRRAATPRRDASSRRDTHPATALAAATHAVLRERATRERVARPRPVPWTPHYLVVVTSKNGHWLAGAGAAVRTTASTPGRQHVCLAISQRNRELDTTTDGTSVSGLATSGAGAEKTSSASAAAERLPHLMIAAGSLDDDTTVAAYEAAQLDFSYDFTDERVAQLCALFDHHVFDKNESLEESELQRMIAAALRDQGCSEADHRAMTRALLAEFSDSRGVNDGGEQAISFAHFLRLVATLEKRAAETMGDDEPTMSGLMRHFSLSLAKMIADLARRSPEGMVAGVEEGAVH